MSETIQLVNGNEFEIDDNDMAELATGYPGVNLATEFSKMRTWLKANPTQRPRSNGLRFVQNWLGKAQGRGPSFSVVRGDKPEPTTQRESMQGDELRHCMSGDRIMSAVIAGMDDGVQGDFKINLWQLARNIHADVLKEAQAEGYDGETIRSKCHGTMWFNVGRLYRERVQKNT